MVHIKDKLELAQLFPLSVEYCNANVAPLALYILYQKVNVGEVNDVRLNGGDHKWNSLDGYIGEDASV